MQLPMLFLTFWYKEAPTSLLLYLFSLNKAFLHMLSIPLFLKTFFKPIKNEYRGDLVGFSIIMGICIKIPLLLAGLGIFLTLLFVQIIGYILFLALPVLTVLILFLNI